MTEKDNMRNLYLLSAFCQNIHSKTLFLAFFFKFINNLYEYKSITYELVSYESSFLTQFWKIYIVEVIFDIIINRTNSPTKPICPKCIIIIFIIVFVIFLPSFIYTF